MFSGVVFGRRRLGRRVAIVGPSGLGSARSYVLYGYLLLRTFLIPHVGLAS